MTVTLISNGKVVEPEQLEPCFGEAQPGIFETFRTYHGRIFRAGEHCDRFLESARTLGMAKAVTKAALLRELEGVLKVCRPQAVPAGGRTKMKNEGDLFIRLTLWNGKVIAMVSERLYPPVLYEKGISLRTSSLRRSHINAAAPQAKTTDYVNPLMAALEPRAKDVFEWLFLDGDGLVSEVSVGNLFIFKRGKLFTPPVSGILNGVTRRFVIECALRKEIRVRETALTRHDVYNACEAFLTNTSWEMLPVSELDGRRIGRKIPGEMTCQLHNFFKQRIQIECPR